MGGDPRWVPNPARSSRCGPVLPVSDHASPRSRRPEHRPSATRAACDPTSQTDRRRLPPNPEPPPPGSRVYHPAHAERSPFFPSNDLLPHRGRRRCRGFVACRRRARAQADTAIQAGRVKEWTAAVQRARPDGWTPKFTHHDLGENFHDTFRVEDGLLKVRYDKWPSFTDEFGHLFYKDPFSYYLLAAEYRFVGEQVKTARTDLAWALRNNGLMLQSPDPEDDDEGSGFPDLDRGAAARRAGQRQAAHHRQPVHAGHQRRR